MPACLRAGGVRADLCARASERIGVCGPPFLYSLSLELSLSRAVSLCGTEATAELHELAKLWTETLRPVQSCIYNHGHFHQRYYHDLQREFGTSNCHN